MSMRLAKGSKADITKGRPQLRQLVIGLGWKAAFNLDAAAFLLNAARQAADEEDFVFYGNLRHRSGSVEHLGDSLIAGKGDDLEEIRIDLNAVPAAVERIAFTLTIYDDGAAQSNFAQVRGAYIRIMDAADGQEILRYDLSDQLSSETAVVIGELYRYKSEWKFSVIDSGFKGGLAALCKSFGIVVCEDEPQPEPPPPSAAAPFRSNHPAVPLAPPAAAGSFSVPTVQNNQPAPQRVPASPNSIPALQNEPRIIPLAADDSSTIPLIQDDGTRQNSVPPNAPGRLNYTPAPLSLSAVELNKGEKIGLATREDHLGEITITLRWKKPQHEKYGLSCFYELTDGNKDIIQSLGNQLGSLNQPPYISLEVGKHTADGQSEDTIRINGAMLAKIQKIFVFTSNFSGLPNWQGSNGELIIRCTGGTEVVIRLSDFVPSHRQCVIAALQNENDTTFSIEKILRFFNMVQEIDQAFNWKLPWCTTS